MDGDPLQRVDNRLIIVETEAQDFGSGVGTVLTVLDGGGVFGLLQVAVAVVPGPAAFDNLQEISNERCQTNDREHQIKQQTIYNV